ncbi:hypothetical protein DVS28_b0290 (plasmid) [Euzebya pacifica]|uniref:Uncharacterized protein n=1 Tax=Euzebya pacifica TaxID=1608957 RepID=A0A346Y6G3_9ACTN|nr:hypothetical protein [Euzebya pacifica]AXV10060.1 hypothetical protein DVS28_b0290 [Euzebya pacifica]
MGWGSTTYPPGTTTLDAFAAEYAGGTEILAAAVADGVVYAAVRHPEVFNGKVVCEVSLYTRESRNGDLWIAFKHMGETMGPNADAAPAKVMDLLDPVEEAYDTAIQRQTAQAWRDRVTTARATRAARKAALPSPGGTATVQAGLDLTPDLSGRTGTVVRTTRKYATLRIDGDLYRLPHALLDLDTTPEG